MSSRRLPNGRVAVWLATLAGVGALTVPVAFAASTPSDFGIALTATPQNGSAPLLVDFQAQVSVGSPTWYSWSFGDGSYANGSGAVYATVSHEYLTGGLFATRVTVSEGALAHTASLAIAVSPGPLSISIAATPNSGTVPVTVAFQGFPAGGSGTYRSVVWTFGDGATATTLVAQHTFVAAGHYHASLSVTDSTGASAISAVWVNLSAVGASSSASPSPSVGLTTLLPMALAAAGASGLVALSIAVRPGARARPKQRDPPEGAETDYGYPSSVVPFGPSVGAIDTAPIVTSAAGSTAAPATARLREPIAPVVDAPKVEVEVELFESRPTAAPLTAVVPLDSPRTFVPGNGHAVDEVEEPRQLSSRVVVFLSQLGALRDDDVPTTAWTQFGMSERLGARQNVISNVLRRLVAAGVIQEELRHVQRQPRRLKVYRLTGRGETLARELRRFPKNDRNGDSRMPLGR
ncbi:MAG TPA: PKD domain-containing protein [Thermoplasmata archaeon]|nr:PKD domain-containing protein [Thermoplasmata archaeon]